MPRTALIVLVSVVVGAAGTRWVMPAASRPEPTATAEPRPLAEPIRDAAVRLAGADDPVPVTVGKTNQAVEDAQKADADKKKKEQLLKQPIRITRVVDGESADALEWPVAKRLRLRSNKLTVSYTFENPKVDKATPVKFKVTPGTNPPQMTGEFKDGTGVLDFAELGKGAPDQTGFFIQAVCPDPTDPNNAIEMPLRLGNSLAPPDLFEVFVPAKPAAEIAQLFNGRYDLGVAPAKGADALIFDGYLKVALKPGGDNREYEAYLFDQADADGVRKRLATSVALLDPTAGGTVAFRVKWDKTPPAKPGLLLLVRERDRGDKAHTFAAAAVEVRATPVLPTVAVTKPVPADDKDPDKYKDTVRTPYHLFGTGAIKVTVAATSPALDAIKAHTRLLVYVDGNPKDPAADPVVVPLDSTQPPVTKDGNTYTYLFEPKNLSGDGDHVITAVLEAGGVTSADQKPLNVRIRRGGFTVATVSPTDFSAASDSQIRITFSPGREVNADTLKAANFLLTLGTPPAGDAAAAASKLTGADPQFDAGSNTAVVQAASPLPPGQYVLTVRAAVTDVYGNPLNGSAGGTGRDATFSIVQPVGGQLPSVNATGGMVAATGPNVEYKEFEPRKFFANGFNPADRVETRVVRLYYYRDAPRVVQIVNRDARAYNAPAVDVRRRAADTARDEANRTIDERKRLEDVAVRAAADTRTAENRLRDLQAQQQTARTQAAAATGLLSQRLSQLDAAQRSFDRDTTTLNTRIATDSSTDAARRRVEQLNLEMAQAQRVLDVTKELTVNDTPETVDAKIRNARVDATGKQRQVVAAFNAAKAAAEANDPAAASAKAEIDKIETDMKTATPQQFAVLNQRLVLAKQKQADVLQAALLKDPVSTQAVETATKDADAAQLKLEQLATAQRALQDLPAKKQALADANRELDRAAARAAGTNAIDPFADASRDTVSATQEEIRKLRQAADAATAAENRLRTEADTVAADVRDKRIKEVEAAQQAGVYERKELRAVQDQFRREVAAATENPDVYGAGKPESDDPVRQCSLSVIGEGLIQIRGPVKGVNVIRMMINQIDAPVGQVRVGVHTVQVNGERVDRMNKVVGNIQRYLDHARFLTVQSTQILRKAITTVAARKAEEAAATLPPNCPQADRDQKYLYSFFGRDFVEELRQLDSEFLRTGNKLLGLHSMDSTSLAAAMSLMALAKNDVRLEIMAEFEAQIQSRLPAAEAAFYQEGLACANKCEACLDKKFCSLSSNARFESFRSYFNAEIQGTDTLSPAQREFIKLAQIFKIRLVTELELKQRVVERSLLEDRLGDYLAELRAAKQKEAEANDALDKARAERQNAVTSLVTVLSQKFVDILSEVSLSIDAAVSDIQDLEQRWDELPTAYGRQDGREYRYVDIDPVTKANKTNRRIKPMENNKYSFAGFEVTLGQFADALRTFGKFRYTNLEAADALNRLRQLQANISKQTGGQTGVPFELSKAEFQQAATDLLSLHRAVKNQLTDINQRLAAIIAKVQDPNTKATDVYTAYSKLIGDASGRILDAVITAEVDKARKKVDKQFANLLGVEARFTQAALAARLARRQLDEKKLLDMLIDDMEEKYIELLDGTRAHTANYDNYLKSLSTALDDDFNTQFYQPAFRKIRSLGASWDVQLGQIESTTVLANNRAFAKVSPAASMEFDLPKRDIFIKEAMKGAKAAVDEYGALLTDPTFLAITKMYSGTPTAAAFAGGGLSPVRNVLPGLPSSADEILMAQAGPNRKEFGAAFEALIPDPSVYKFETGTGYEVRPVMSPDGQAVVFNFDYMYTTDVREPVRADEKHLGRVKRHFVHTDVQLSNYEMREVSKYWVSLKAARTGRGVQLLQDVPGVGVLFRPLPSASSSLQQNLIYSQATLFPTLFDLMGLRYAPTIADIDPEFTKNDEFVVRGRRDYLRQFIFDYGASRVDDALRILHGDRRTDLYRSQHTIPYEHPNGYRGPGMRLRDGSLQEDYNPLDAYPPTPFSRGLHAPLPSAPPAGGWDVPPPVGELPYGKAPVPSVNPTATAGRSYTAQPLGTTVSREAGPRNLAPLPTAPRAVVAPSSYPAAPPIPPPPTPVGPN